MSTPCPLCGSPIDTSGLCPPCGGLLRWVGGYFAHVPDMVGKITLATHFINDLGVESLDWMDWLLEAEEKLDIAIPDDRAERIQTVGEFFTYLRRAGASWPDGRDLLLRPRPRCWSSYVWDVVEDRASGQNGS